MITDYESWGAASMLSVLPPTIEPVARHFSRDDNTLTEAFSGVAIVAWYGTIERQLEEMIDKSEANRNHPYANSLRQFLKTWRENEISGSINRETLDVLKSSAAQLAVSDWKYANYFSNLRDQLRKLVASEEELPREAPPERPKKGGRAGAPEPPEGDYGPTAEEPNVQDGSTTMAGGPGGAASAGGASNV
jgi:hypothetical protein